VGDQQSYSDSDDPPWRHTESCDSGEDHHADANNGYAETNVAPDRQADQEENHGVGGNDDIDGSDRAADIVYDGASVERRARTPTSAQGAVSSFP